MEVFSYEKWGTDLEDKIKKIEVNSKYNPVTDNDLSFVQMEIGNIFKQNEPESRKVLGVIWNKNNDKFVFDFSNIIKIAKEIDPTKRNILKLIVMFFDPLGLISPIVLQPKLLFKKLCVIKYDWDSILSAEYIRNWYKFINELNSLRSISVDRSVLCNCKVKQVELHGFCDSSIDPYCACVYVRVVCQYSLLASKCRLAPSKLNTIPRLEFMFAVVQIDIHSQRSCWM